jgi:hypothetical protein
VRGIRRENSNRIKSYFQRKIIKNPFSLEFRSEIVMANEIAIIDVLFHQQHKVGYIHYCLMGIFSAKWSGVDPDQKLFADCLHTASFPQDF